MIYTVLKVNSLSAFYGRVQAVKEVTFEVGKGKGYAVLGPNGAGKTTLIRAIAGLKPPQIKGEIELLGEKINDLPAEKRVRRGISTVLEGRRNFIELTVDENLTLGAYSIRRNAKRVKELKDLVLESFPVLKKKLKDRAAFLSGGEQQMLAIGRAIMTDPGLILLDEPSFGLAPKIVSRIFNSLKTLMEEKNLTVVLVEQDALLALNFTQDAMIIAAGSTVLKGSSDSLKKDEKLMSVYLGGTH